MRGDLEIEKTGRLDGHFYFLMGVDYIDPFFKGHVGIVLEFDHLQDLLLRGAKGLTPRGVGDVIVRGGILVHLEGAYRLGIVH